MFVFHALYILVVEITLFFTVSHLTEEAGLKIIQRAEPDDLADSMEEKISRQIILPMNASSKFESTSIQNILQVSNPKSPLPLTRKQENTDSRKNCTFKWNLKKTFKHVSTVKTDDNLPNISNFNRACSNEDPALLMNSKSGDHHGTVSAEH